MNFYGKVKKFGEHQFEFKRIFGFSISRCVDPLYGFDIVSFDRTLAVPDGISCKAYIKAKYGKDAAKLIEDLLKI